MCRRAAPFWGLAGLPWSLSFKQEGIRPYRNTRARPLAAVAAVEAGLPTGVQITAPFTGIFYRSPSPQADAFIQVGSDIAKGDVIGLIEAMKLFNEIRATAGGKVRRILIESGQLVRAQQPIVELE